MEITILVLGAIVVGITQILKGLVPKAALVPVLALIVGIGISILGGEYINVVGIKEQIITGLVLGLSAVGMYSAGATINNELKK